MPSKPLDVPETKPATEVIDGRFTQKMSPFGLQARVQLRIAGALQAWSDECGRGRVGTEWDFDLTPPGDRTHRLVPDAAYLSYGRVDFRDERAAQVPDVAPNVAIEILSKGQTFENSVRRVEIYVSAGAELVILIDPRSERACLVDSRGSQFIDGDARIEHSALPGFSLPLRTCFHLVPPGGAAG
jgi:Uma2 family endonuclease